MAPLRRVKLTELNAHLVCVLCSGYFVDATTIIECLHTFCKTCIVRYLQTSSFCPICDVQVHKTKPLLSLREDRTLQDVVFKLVPGLFHSEMKRRLHFYKGHPEAGGDKTEQSLRERRHFFHVDDQISLSLEYLPSAPTSHSHLHGLKPLKINNGPQEKPKVVVDDDKECVGGKKDDEKNDDHKEEQDNKVPGKVIHKRYLRCPAAVQVSHLEKFIRLKYSLTSQTHRVDIMHGGDCLVGELTLLDVVYMYKWTEDAPLRLMYTVSAIPQSRKRLRPNGLRTPAATDPDAPEAKVPKTQSSIQQQQQQPPPAHQQTYFQLHPVHGRDQDAMETNIAEENSTAENGAVGEKKIEVLDKKSVCEILKVTASNCNGPPGIGLVSSHMPINIPSLPNTILNSGIGQLSASLPSGRRTAFTKTTASTATPRMAVPNKSFTASDSSTSSVAIEGVTVSVQVTTSSVTVTSSVGVSLTSTTTNTNVLPTAPLPVPVPRPSINGVIDSCSKSINPTSSQPTKVLQPIIPTKPRLGRPPNASRVAAASMKSGIRVVDPRQPRPVAPSKVVNKVPGVLNRVNPTISASLNVQSRLKSISGPKPGTAKVSIKRLSDVSKAVESGGIGENAVTKVSSPTPTTVHNTIAGSQPLSSMATALAQSQQSSSSTLTLQSKNISSCQNSDVATTQRSLTVSGQKLPAAPDIQKPGTQSIQRTVIPTKSTQQASGVNTTQNSPFTPSRFPGSQSMVRPTNPTLPSSSDYSPTSIVPQNSSGQSLQPVNNQVSLNSQRSPAPSQVVTCTVPLQSTSSSQSSSVPSIVSANHKLNVPGNSSHPSMNINKSPLVNVTTALQAQPITSVQKTSSNTTPAPQKTPIAPMSGRTAGMHTANRLPTLQHRTPGSPAPHKTSASPAPLRTAASPVTPRATPNPPSHRPPASPAPHRSPANPTQFKTTPSPVSHRPPSSPAPHRAPPSPAPHRAPQNPAPHRAPPSPAPHRAPPSPAPHRAPPSPAPHRAPPSPAPHRAPPSPAPHRAPPSPAPHRAPPSPAPHRAPPSPAPHRTSPSPASQAPPSPASLQAPPSPASVQVPVTSVAPAFQIQATLASSQAPPSPACSSASQRAQMNPSPSNSKPPSTLPSITTSTTLAQSQSVSTRTATTISMSPVTPNSAASVARVSTSNVGNKVSISKTSTTAQISTNSPSNNCSAKVAPTKVSPGVKAPPKSPGRKRGSGGSSPTILSIAQNLANRQLQQRTINSTPLPSPITTNTTPVTQVCTPQAYTNTTPNTVVYPNAVGSGLVSPAFAAAYMATAYGGDASALTDVTAMRNLFTLSQTAACIRELNLAAMVQAAETLPRPSDPAPIDLSPTSKAAPQSPLTNGRGQSITTTSPVTTNSKVVQSPKQVSSKTNTNNTPTAPTISPPTPEVTITKLPSSTPATSTGTIPTSTAPGKTLPGLVKLASSSTNTVSITKRPVSGHRIAVAKSPANASIRQIPNPSFLRHQSEVRNNNNVTSKSSPVSSNSKGSTTSAVSTKNQQSPKLTTANRTTGNSPLKDTGPLPETSSILKIEHLTRSLAAPAAASGNSASFRFFENR